jgi:hypothetical protein
MWAASLSTSVAASPASAIRKVNAAMFARIRCSKSSRLSFYKSKSFRERFAQLVSRKIQQATSVTGGSIQRAVLSKRHRVTWSKSNDVHFKTFSCLPRVVQRRAARFPDEVPLFSRWVSKSFLPTHVGANKLRVVVNLLRCSGHSRGQELTSSRRVQSSRHRRQIRPASTAKRRPHRPASSHVPATREARWCSIVKPKYHLLKRI